MITDISFYTQFDRKEPFLIDIYHSLEEPEELFRLIQQANPNLSSIVIQESLSLTSLDHCHYNLDQPLERVFSTRDEKKAFVAVVLGYQRMQEYLPEVTMCSFGIPIISQGQLTKREILGAQGLKEKLDRFKADTCLSNSALELIYGLEESKNFLPALISLLTYSNIHQATNLKWELPPCDDEVPF